jgi:hypothetical protein
MRPRFRVEFRPFLCPIVELTLLMNAKKGGKNKNMLLMSIIKSNFARHYKLFVTEFTA